MRAPHEVLGIAKNATPEEVVEAHRRLMLYSDPAETRLRDEIEQAKDEMIGQPERVFEEVNAIPHEETTGENGGIYIAFYKKIILAILPFILYINAYKRYIKFMRELVISEWASTFPDSPSYELFTKFINSEEFLNQVSRLTVPLINTGPRFVIFALSFLVILSVPFLVRKRKRAPFSGPIKIALVTLVVYVVMCIVSYSIALPWLFSIRDNLIPELEILALSAEYSFLLMPWRGDVPDIIAGLIVAGMILTLPNKSNSEGATNSLTQGKRRITLKGIAANLTMAIGILGYVAVGIYYFVALCDGIQYLTGFPSFFSGLIGVFLTGIAGVNLGFALVGVIKVWGWSVSKALLCYVLAPMVFMLVIGVIGVFVEYLSEKSR